MAAVIVGASANIETGYRVGVRHALAVLVISVVSISLASGCGAASPEHSGHAAGRASTSPAPSAGASGRSMPAAATSTQPVDPALAPYLARLPHFAPPPPPQPIAVPSGPKVPLYHRLPVNQPVAFLTMDDGWTQLPDAIPLMRAAHIPFTMFLIAPVAAKSPAFFKGMESAGGVIEDHTITHPDMKGKSYQFQHHEVCDARTSLAHTFGTTMTFFRPPFGDYDQTTLKAVHDCGLRAAFDWSETVNNGIVYYQTSTHRIQPGDIILMHFRPAFLADVTAALTAIHNAGLTPALLENYLSFQP